MQFLWLKFPKETLKSMLLQLSCLYLMCDAGGWGIKIYFCGMMNGSPCQKKMPSPTVQK